MHYYVPLGRCGLILRVGASLTALLGSVVYWGGTMRRARVAPRPHLAADWVERRRKVA